MIETNLEVLAKKYNVDKLDHGFIDVYSEFLKPKREKIKTVLEIGVYKGDSLKMWADYFPQATIYGWDLTYYNLGLFGNRVKTYFVNQEDRNSIEVFFKTNKIKFDVIIDDGSHTMQGQQLCLGLLWKYLADGGVYIVEDLHTSLPHNPHEWVGGKCLPDFSNSSLLALRQLQNTGNLSSVYLTKDEAEAISNSCCFCRVYDTKNDERHITSVLIKEKGELMSFEKIYNTQENFENLLISKSDKFPDKKMKDFDEKERTTLSKELALLLHQEISEFINAVGNYKSHKTQRDGKGPKEIKEEIADMFIFVLDMALAHNMSAKELLDEVKSKQDINFKRQENGY